MAGHLQTLQIFAIMLSLELTSVASAISLPESGFEDGIKTVKKVGLKKQVTIKPSGQLEPGSMILCKKLLWSQI